MELSRLVQGRGIGLVEGGEMGKRLTVLGLSGRVLQPGGINARKGRAEGEGRRVWVARGFQLGRELRREREKNTDRCGWFLKNCQGKSIYGGGRGQVRYVLKTETVRGGVGERA